MIIKKVVLFVSLILIYAAGMILILIFVVSHVNASNDAVMNMQKEMYQRKTDSLMIELHKARKPQ